MRKHRPYLPGCAFHLMSRTVGHEPWYAVFRDEIIGIIADGLKHTDALLNAYVLMSNHFHLVVQQRIEPLSALMQPVCRRIALRTHVLHSREGHIVERRFRSKLCATPAHLRRAIAYVHRNPVTAKLCDDVGAYPWSSHWAYTGRPAPENAARCALPVVAELPLFATEPNRTQSELQRDYGRYADYCAADAARAEYEPPPNEPPVLAGDRYWATRFGALAPQLVKPPRGTVKEIALAALAELTPDVTLEALRFRRGGPRWCLVRRTIVERAVAEGFAYAEIARELNISETAVSKIARKLPWGPQGR